MSGPSVHLADVAPFRGVSADVGTAFEMGRA
jgi:nucleoside 2-deoxyribosyltransferase